MRYWLLLTLYVLLIVFCLLSMFSCKQHSKPRQENKLDSGDSTVKLDIEENKGGYFYCDTIGIDNSEDIALNGKSGIIYIPAGNYEFVKGRLIKSHEPIQHEHACTPYIELDIYADSLKVPRNVISFGNSYGVPILHGLKDTLTIGSDEFKVYIVKTCKPKNRYGELSFYHTDSACIYYGDIKNKPY